ncbi:hypothetical protein PV08_09566 [Exophiala spinifera]|uniref:FAD/NAD(P)-binding domain-containing protein n=1 Tax=Exophiala spinifera TaxID=91928 RepID=A0A0D2BM69_9EURO|nr:uncharacterized protein PV08_09566 [Exophiala spinifera]KIW12289.1 hypothetical protein PV08_09566 [Exophiala spinifera]
MGSIQESGLLRYQSQDNTSPALPDLDSYKPSGFKIESRALDDSPTPRVSVIGAGLSGINAAILLPVKVPGIDLTIFEKNADVGGTWLENTYPGVRCDIPANVYQSTYTPNRKWSQEYAEGEEIREYWQATARKYNVYKYLKLRHKVHQAEWDSTDSQWKLLVEDLESGTTREERFDFLIAAIGIFNAWKLPDYPGRDEYEGHIRHTSNWDSTLDASGKTIAVIGNGASGIQVLPQLQKVARRIDHYARNPTWVLGSFGIEERSNDPVYFTEEQLKSFEDDATYYKFRTELESGFYRSFFRVFGNTNAHQKAKKDITERMAKLLESRPELLKKVTPDFPPFCRRPTPGPGYLEALTQDNVEYISTPIQRFTKTGIVTTDGVSRDVDAIICATGANTDFAPAFPIIANGIDLNKAWKPSGSYKSPSSYFGLAAPYFPNLFFTLGPNSFGLSGTLNHSVETAVTYIAKVLRKMTSQGIKTIVPSKAATDDFMEYVDSFFATTVLSENCKSWYIGGIPGQRIHGPWPGSSHHVTQVRLDPRWEDYEYTYKSRQRNRYAYFGGGFTKNDLDKESDMTPYLRQNPDDIDLREYHEKWYEYAYKPREAVVEQSSEKMKLKI